MYLRRLKDISKKSSLLRCFWEVSEMSLSMVIWLRSLRDISYRLRGYFWLLLVTPRFFSFFILITTFFNVLYVHSFFLGAFIFLCAFIFICALQALIFLRAWSAFTFFKSFQFLTVSMYLHLFVKCTATRDQVQQVGISRKEVE